MKILIMRGCGEGSTKLSAFDCSIKQAGVYNYNIIHLSSIIPPKTRIVIGKESDFVSSDYGKRLYAVLAEIRSHQKGYYIGAGLGWYQFADGSGVFVEHVAETSNYQETKNKLTIDIRLSIKDLCRFRRKKFEISKLKKMLSISKVGENPVSVVVLAKYKVEGWE